MARTDGAKVDRHKGTELDKATREVRRLKRALGRNVHQIGTVLRDVRDRKLYEARHASFEAYLDDEAGVSRSTAFEFIKVAGTFKEDVVQELGPTRLLAALDYIATTPASEKPEDILSLTIPVRQNGKVHHRKISDLSSRAIRRARNEAAARRAPARERGWANRLATAANAAFSRARMTGGVSVVADAPRRDGSQTIRIVGLGPDNAWKVFAMLANVVERLTEARTETAPRTN